MNREDIKTINRIMQDWEEADFEELKKKMALLELLVGLEEIENERI